MKAILPFRIGCAAGAFFCLLLFRPVATAQVWAYGAGYGQSVTGAAEFGKAVAADASGNVYMTGEFAGTVDFGGGGLTSAGAFDGFVASYTSAGAFRWAIRFGGGGTDQGVSIATNGTDVYITGNFTASATLMTVSTSPTTYTAAGSTDGFVIKLNAASGAVTWVKLFGGTGAELGQSLTLDPSGNLYMSGTFSQGSGGATFGAAGVRNVQGGAGTDMFVAQMNAAGDFVWVSTGGGTGTNDNGTGSGICYVPALNEIVVTGAIRADASGSAPVNAVYTTSSPASSVTLTNSNTGAAAANNYDFVLLELNASNGVFISGIDVGSTNNEEGVADAYDPFTGDVFFTGYFSSPSTTFPGNPAITNTGGGGVNNIFYGRYNPATNAFTWIREVENSNPAGANDVGTGIASDGAGALYVTGYFTNTTAFRKSSNFLTLTAAGAQDDPFLVKIEAATGDALLAAQGSGDNASTDDRSNGVAVAATRVWITGQYGSNLTFSPLAALTSSGGGQDIFLAALIASPTISTDPSNVTACSGLPATFSVVAAGGTGLSYQWQEATNSAFTGPVTLGNSGVYSGTGTTALSISDNTGLNGRYYRVIVTNSGGRDTSTGVLLTVTAPSLPATTTTETHTIGTNNNLSYGTSCAAIDKVVPLAGSPVSGSVTSTVWRESSVLTYGGQPYVQRHYQITPASGSTGTVTLYFTQAEFDNFNSHPGSTADLPTGTADAAGKAALRISRFTGTSSNGTGLPGTYSTSGSAVIDPPDANIVFNMAFSRWEVTFDVNGFGGFFVQTFSGVLPVKLASFSARKAAADIQLQWQTTGELATDRFEIERSNDGRNFTAAGQVAATNNGAVKDYQWIDANAATVASSLYYRLKIIDKTGSIEYSNTVIVSSGRGAAFASVFPTAFSDRINLSLRLPKSGQLNVTLADLSGRILHRQTITSPQGYSTQTVRGLQGLASGVYLLSVEAEGEWITQKVVK